MSDIKARTMEEAFYLQSKAFFEKNAEHLAEINRLKAEVDRLKSDNQRIGEELLQIRMDVLKDPVLREVIKDAVMNPRRV